MLSRVTHHNKTSKYTPSNPKPQQNECSHCNRIMNNFAGGYGRVNNQVVCHPNIGGRPNCYELVTVYKHSMPCSGTVCYEDHDDKLVYINSPESQTLVEALQGLADKIGSGD